MAHRQPDELTRNQVTIAVVEHSTDANSAGARVDLIVDQLHLTVERRTFGGCGAHFDRDAAGFRRRIISSQGVERTQHDLFVGVEAGIDRGR